MGAAVVLALLTSAPTSGDVVQALAILLTSVLITLAVGYAWLRHLPNSQRFGGLILKQANESGQGHVAALRRPELVGKAGVAVTDLRPAGVASVEGERIDVVTEGEYVGSGDPIEVLRADGYRHVVRAAKD